MAALGACSRACEEGRGRGQSWGRRALIRCIAIDLVASQGDIDSDSDRDFPRDIEDAVRDSWSWKGEGGNAVSFDLISLILQAGLIVKLVLLVLLGFSITSITIIVSKWTELRAADQDSEAFLEVYRREGFSQVYDAARHLDRSPLAIVFLTAGEELQGARDRHASDQRREKLRTQLSRSIVWEASAQGRKLERGLSFLATTGSSTPFIGLFGTVVGIIAAFQSIGEAGQASLAVVGPGIAEALVATAVGLVTAIPATIAYNSFGTRIDGVMGMLERFCSQFQEDLDRMLQAQPAHLAHSDRQLEKHADGERAARAE